MDRCVEKEMNTRGKQEVIFRILGFNCTNSSESVFWRVEVGERVWSSKFAMMIDDYNAYPLFPIFGL